MYIIFLEQLGTGELKITDMDYVDSQNPSYLNTGDFIDKVFANEVQLADKLIGIHKYKSVSSIVRQQQTGRLCMVFDRGSSIRISEFITDNVFEEFSVYKDYKRDGDTLTFKYIIDTDGEVNVIKLGKLVYNLNLRDIRIESLMDILRSGGKCVDTISIRLSDRMNLADNLALVKVNNKRIDQTNLITNSKEMIKFIAMDIINTMKLSRFSTYPLNVCKEIHSFKPQDLEITLKEYSRVYPGLISDDKFYYYTDLKNTKELTQKITCTSCYCDFDYSYIIGNEILQNQYVKKLGYVGSNLISLENELKSL